MTNTPETDGITFKATKDMMPPYDTVPSEFSRRLERERDQWRECAEKLADWMGVPKYGETFEQSVATKNAALAEFERLKRGGCVLTSPDGTKFGLTPELVAVDSNALYPRITIKQLDEVSDLRNEHS
jgi:hypothetical protein